MKIKHLIKKIWKIHKSQMKKGKYPSIILPPTHQPDCGRDQRGGKRSYFFLLFFYTKFLENKDLDYVFLSTGLSIQS